MRNSWIQRFIPLLWLVALMWVVFLVDSAASLQLSRFGILPRNSEGLLGIVTWSFLHGNLSHIANNSVSLLIFGGIVAARSRDTFIKLTAYVIPISGVCVWVFGRPAVHIGASGLVFGYFGYLVTRGFYDRQFLSVTISIVVILVWGSLVWGVLPSDGPVSWEGHLAGLLAGAAFARVSKKPRGKRRRAY
ncbi:rhomboid family intramembrane serine protease [Pelagicoccus sp. SDUM812003]|uniref:rhomboid family intramembrane serine protease n=1 Tax=Pelagicoccus sp. SDUM812003 TaxID=3041267 RepID=UPI00280FC890|nr:rhomboid family intramembrane serine protease [Pelagicoccus sp. SDUM812003]MDQ8204762.1 rhomboid family intramembrane serine protease [Pelagicoccus sp. SDUM812003]